MKSKLETIKIMWRQTKFWTHDRMNSFAINRFLLVAEMIIFSSNVSTIGKKRNFYSNGEVYNLAESLDILAVGIDFVLMETGVTQVDYSFASRINFFSEKYYKGSKMFVESWWSLFALLPRGIVIKHDFFRSRGMCVIAKRYYRLSIKHE